MLFCGAFCSIGDEPSTFSFTSIAATGVAIVPPIR